MKKVLFFDVETNNLRNDRICQLAVIYEEDGKEKYSNSWYINPESPFSERTVQIHGITSEMVKDAPTFPEVWKEIHEYFERSLVIGHNVSFDLTVLDKVFQFYDISADSFTYGDTKDKALQMYNCPDLQNSEKRNGCFAFAACRFASAERSVDAICLSLDCACSCH